MDSEDQKISITTLIGVSVAVLTSIGIVKVMLDKVKPPIEGTKQKTR